MFIDSHCHLIFDELRNDLPAVLSQMEQAKVKGALCICTTLQEFDAIKHLVSQHSHLWASVGVHPDYEFDDAKQPIEEPSLEELVHAAQGEKVIAIGETGLDYYRLNGRSIADMHWQRERFHTHIRAAQTTKKPLIIHTRNAGGDTLAILKEEGEIYGNTHDLCAGGVFHCFTEDVSFAREALDLGFYISFSGIITFKNAQSIGDVVKFVPLERILIETDSPYLAPVPHRGKTNNPSYVPYVANQIAHIKNLDIYTVAKATTENFFSLFKTAQFS